jgi:ATP-dependent DNA ligase
MTHYEWFNDALKIKVPGPVCRVGGGALQTPQSMPPHLQAHRPEIALPRVMPLVLKRRAKAFDKDAWLFDLKYDGFRALLEIDAADARLVSRNRHRFRHLDPARGRSGEASARQ